MTNSVRKDLKEMNVDSVIIAGGCTKYIQAPDVYWNKPFKTTMTELYDQWLSEGVHQFTKGGIMEFPSRKGILNGYLMPGLNRQKKNIKKLFTCCGLNVANDGTEDDFFHCLKKGQTCEVERQKLNSQLSILVEESDAINLFISPFDEEDANVEINVIDDETDEEIIM